MGATVPSASPPPTGGRVREGGADPRERAALDAALLAAHGRGDQPALARLYAQAGDAAESAGETDAACFFLTQAYVFALASGAKQASALHARLLAHGREE